MVTAGHYADRNSAEGLVKGVPNLRQERKLSAALEGPWSTTYLVKSNEAQPRPGSKGYYIHHLF